MKHYKLWSVLVMFSFLFIGCSNSPSERDLRVDSIIEETLSRMDDATRIIVSTVDLSGTPHIMVAGSLTKTGINQVVVGDWDCPVTSTTMVPQDQYAPVPVSIVIWNEGSDSGAQLYGTYRNNVLAANPAIENPPEPVLEVEVSKIVGFARQSHDDNELR